MVPNTYLLTLLVTPQRAASIPRVIIAIGRRYVWKQWRKPRTKVRKLLALGTSRWQAIRTGLSSKAYWHLSRALATQTGMTKDWLTSQGLISVRDLWMKTHGYA